MPQEKKQDEKVYNLGNKRKKINLHDIASLTRLLEVLKNVD